MPGVIAGIPGEAVIQRPIDIAVVVQEPTCQDGAGAQVEQAQDGLDGRVRLRGIGEAGRGLVDGLDLVPPEILATLVDVVIHGEVVALDGVLRAGGVCEGGVEQDLVVPVVAGEDEILLAQLGKNCWALLSVSVLPVGRNCQSSQAASGSRKTAVLPKVAQKMLMTLS